MIYYKEEVCIAIINDKYSSQNIIESLFNELMNEEFGNNLNNKLDFIKSNLNHKEISHIDDLIYNINGDSVEFLALFDIDYDDLDSINNSKDIWETSAYSGEIQDRIDELTEEQNLYDEDEDY